MTEGLIVFGHAYAVGQPTPILARTSTSACSIIGPHVCVNSSGAVVPIDNGAMPNIADALAHYGPPESLVGKWALQMQVTP